MNNLYKNIFLESEHLVFIININDFSLIELNNNSLQFIDNLERKNLNILDCFKSNEIKNSLKTAIKKIKNDLKYVSFDSNIGNTYQVFDLKIDKYNSEKVIILTVKEILNNNEIQLKETKKNISTILENINSFIYNISFVNDEVQVKFISSKAEELLKIDIQDLIIKFKSGQTKEFLHPEDIAYVIRKVKDATDTLKIQKLSYRLIIENEIRYFEETIFPKLTNNVISHFGIVTDVSEQKKGELLLIHSEEKHRQLFEKSLAGIYKTNEKGDIIDVNIAFANMLGFNTIDELKNNNIKDFYFNTTDRKQYINTLKKDISVSNQIVILKNKNGERIIASNNAFIYTENNISYITGTIIDVTELHETSEKLKKNQIILIESQQTFKNIVDSSPAALFIFNKDNELLYNNTKGTSLLKTFLNKDKKYLKNIFDKKHRYIIENLIMEADNPTQSYTQINFNTKKFVVEVVKINYRSKPCNLILFRDITIEQEFNSQKMRAEIAEEVNINLEKEIIQHKKTQQLLIENKNFTDSLFDSSLDMIIASDTNNVITLVNKAATLKFGYSKEEMIGQNLSIIVPKKYGKKNVQNTIIENNKFIGEVDNITKSGKEFTSYLSATSTVNEKGELTGFMGISRDLSEINEIQDIITNQSSVIDSLFKNDSDIFIWNLNKNLELDSFNKGIYQFFKTIKIELESGENFLKQIELTIDKSHFKIVSKHFKNALKGKKSNFTIKIINPKNKTKKYWADIYLTPIILPNGKIKNVMCLGTNITEQILKNNLIKKNETKLKAILKAIPDLMFNVTKNGVILDVKAHTEHQSLLIKKFFNKDETIINKNLKDILKSEPEFSEKVLNLIVKSIEKEELITHNFSHNFGHKVLHFENRYSKVNNNEVIIVTRETTEDYEKEKKIKDSLQEKEVLLKEVHHRVKNNLQIINSILNLQSSYIEDEKTLEIIKESQNRIRSMSFIHESLYQTNNFSSINFKEYIENLLSNLAYSYQLGTKIKIIKNIEDIDLSLDQAIPCGLILNELITNSLKYAYKGNDDGKICITINKIGNKIEMIVEDFGIGLPKNFNIESTESLGLSLVYTLTDQIDGELMVKSDGGTKFLIIFEML